MQTKLLVIAIVCFYAIDKPRVIRLHWR